MRGVSEQPAATPEQPSRYNRSAGGLVAAMIATVLFVAAYVGFRALTRDQPDIEQKVDYLSCVAYLQEADITVAYPAQLPAGWRATSIDFERGTTPDWRIGMLTDDDEYVGVVESSKDVDDLLHSYVDPSPARGPVAGPTNALGSRSWQTWTDSGGDSALSTTLGPGPLEGQRLLVYGSGSFHDLATVLGLLTTDPVTSATSAADCDTDAL
jgi:uncharacterized protein DUF4245